MSHTEVSVHVRGAGRDAVLGAIEKRLARRGLERVPTPSASEAMLTRVRLRERGAWVSVAIEELDTPDDLARSLARDLDATALGAWFWEDEATLDLTLFEGSGRPSKLSLPRDARRGDGGRVVIPLGGLSRLIGKGDKKTGLEVLTRDDDAQFEDGGRCVYLSDASHVLQRAFGIEALLLDPLDEDTQGEILYFRPKASSAIAKRARAEEEEIARERRANHDGRLYTVGWLAFVVRPREIERVLETTARPITEAMTPHLGPRVLLARAVVPGKGETQLPPPSDGDKAWRRYARSLRDGALVGLGRKEAPVLASAWLVLRDDVLVVGWCMRGLKDPEKRRALAEAMDAVVGAGAQDPRCFGALVTAQRTPMSLEQQALAYEYLRGTSADALRPASHKDRARAPGWRVLVPKRATSRPPKGFVARDAAAGLLVGSTAPDPLDVPPGAIDALEAWLAR